MNLIKKTTLALALLAAAGTSFAQTAAANSNGLLGARYTEFSYGLHDVDSAPDYGHGLTAKVNAPVIPALLDVGGLYSYEWVRGVVHGHANSLAAYANAYVPLDGAKPFVGATLGYSWVSLPRPLNDDDGFWNVAFGVEIPLGAFTFTPKITYADDFNGRVGDTNVWIYEVEGHYWFSPKAGAFASVSLQDEHRDPINVWVYRVGLRLRF